MRSAAPVVALGTCWTRTVRQCSVQCAPLALLPASTAQIAALMTTAMHLRCCCLSAAPFIMLIFELQALELFVVSMASRGVSIATNACIPALQYLHRAGTTRCHGRLPSQSPAALPHLLTLPRLHILEEDLLRALAVLVSIFTLPDPTMLLPPLQPPPLPPPPRSPHPCSPRPANPHPAAPTLAAPTLPTPTLAAPTVTAPKLQAPPCKPHPTDSRL